MLSAVLVASLTLASANLRPVDPSQPGSTRPVKLLQGSLTAPVQGDLIEGARDFVLARRAQFGLPQSATLGEPIAFGTRFGGSVHFPQKAGEFEVDGAKVVVTFNSHREIIRVSSGLRPYSSAQLKFRLSAEDAMATAAHAIHGALLRLDGSPYGAWKRLMFPVGDEVRAGFLVFVPTLLVSENWFVAVDAATGEILWTENRVKHVKAHVYGADTNYSPGAGGVASAPLTEVELTHLSADRVPGPLQGDQISIFNCCANQGCDPNGSPRTWSGMLSFGGEPLPYESVVCDRVQRANDAINGDFIYTPVDPPVTNAVTQSDPADSDEFVEVQAFYHVNKVYDFIRELSVGAGSLLDVDPRFVPFMMRDARAGRKPYVWTNLSTPNFYEGEMQDRGGQQTYVVNEMVREDNAAFLARENFEVMSLPPEYMLDADTLLIYQGNVADFGYDAPVLWHEFGHGVIYSTANFRSFIVDSLSANDEGAAMHEAIADYLSGALGQSSRIGTYVGPRMETGTSLRDMENDYRCPNILVGQSHNDSQHFSAALWEARKFFLLGDGGRTFDAAVYAALVSMGPTTGFQEAGDILIDSIAAAFPDVPVAHETVQGIFDARGVTNCSKTLEVPVDGWFADVLYVGGRAQVGLSSASFVPAPYQLKRVLPNGALSISVSARLFGGFQGVRPSFTLLTKSGSPVIFTPAGSRLLNDAEAAFNSEYLTQGRTATATATFDLPCGTEVYLALGNGGFDQLVMSNLNITVQPRPNCEVAPDVNASKEIAAAPHILGQSPGGCSSTGAIAGQLAGLLLLTLAMRRRRRE